ncbi:MAG TPA: helix-turn-helix domain-containing protein [Clostridiales bacterium]|jgi:AraC-like DNA-binding protein|nr:helix-turn-helix domain-containing protein [Clostridiales bacterium]
MSAWVSSFDTDEADTVILGFGEVSVGGISDSADKELMSFGGRGLGTIACRLLYVFAGSKINLFYEDDEKPVTRNLDGGEDGLIVFVAPRPKSRLEIKAGSERLDGSRFMYIDYLTSRPAVPSGKVYVTPLGRRRDIGCYLELIRELYVKYYTEGENDCVLSGCRNAAKGLVDYAPQALEIPLLSEPRVINALKEIKRDLPRVTRSSAAVAGGVSSVYMGVLFADTVSISIGRYIREYRLCMAQLYIRGGMTVEDAARMVGYTSGSSFARAKKHFRGEKKDDETAEDYDDESDSDD